MSIYLMEPKLRDGSDVIYFEMAPFGRNQLDLTNVRDLLEFYDIMQEMERRALLMKENFNKKSSIRFIIPPRDSPIGEECDRASIRRFEDT